VTCISPLGLCSRWSLGENLYADHREAEGEAGMLATKWPRPAQGVFLGGLTFHYRNSISCRIMERLSAYASPGDYGGS
jgi:hypothetical protein